MSTSSIIIQMSISMWRFDQKQLVDTYHQSIIDDETPDLFLIPDQELGSFSEIDGLENLLEAKYYDQDFFEKRPNGFLENYLICCICIRSQM